MHASWDLVRTKPEAGREEVSLRLVRLLAPEILLEILAEYRRAVMAAQRYEQLRRQGTECADLSRRMFVELYTRSVAETSPARRPV